MTAAQTSIALKGSRSYGSMIAVVVIALMVAITVVAISARPLAAPATTLNQSAPLTVGHDEGRFTAPTLTSGHDEARPSSVQVRVPSTVPGQARQYHPTLQGQQVAPRRSTNDHGK